MTAKRLLLLLGAGTVVLATSLALSWHDVLPGGWTLRGWVEPHAEREARARAEHSAERRAAFAEEDPPAESVVFLGSSTMERYPLEASFPGAPTVDRGIGDESCEELLARLEETWPSPAPAGAVLYLASIDFRRLASPPAVVRARAARVLDTLERLRPGLAVALVGILPERDMPPEMVARLRETNAGLAGLCAERGAAFVSTDRPPVTAPDGSLAAGLAADRLHLNDEGYAVLTGWLLEDGGAVADLLRGSDPADR